MSTRFETNRKIVDSHPMYKQENSKVLFSIMSGVKSRLLLTTSRFFLVIL